MYALGTHKNDIPFSVIDKLNELGKNDYTYIEDGDRKFLLAGTPPVIEDAIEAGIQSLFCDISASFTGIWTKECDPDDLSELRDKLIEAHCKANNYTIVYRWEEF